MLSKVLPPGAVLSPLLTGDNNKRAPVGLSGQRGGKTHSRRSGRHSDRFAAINGFVDGVMGSLPRAAALTWFCLWRDTRNGVARTSIPDLARRVHGSERNIKRAVNQLVKRQLIEVVRKGGLGRGVSVYRVKVG
jgi:hypothetical protein